MRIKNSPKELFPLSDGGYVSLCRTVCRSGTSKLICKVINWNKWNVFIFSQILTEYVGIEPRVSVCLSVCVSLCLSVCLSMCVISTPKRMVRFLRNFPKKRGQFSQILKKSKLMTSCRLFYTFFDAALSWSHFLSDFSWKFMRRCKLVFRYLLKKISKIGP